MKSLFIIFQNIEEASGISNKILSQVNSLKENGLDIDLCYIDDSSGNRLIKVKDKIIDNQGKNIIAHINYYTRYSKLLKYIIKNDIKFVYIRYVHNATPFFNILLRKLKEKDITIYLEIPTFPYDKEHNSNSFKHKILKLVEHNSRNKFNKYISKIVTFSDDNYIFGVETIKISNAIDFNKVNKKLIINDTSKKIRFIGVAVLAFWHGFDRFISGMNNYYKRKPIIEIYFTIVGWGNEDLISKYKNMAYEYKLEKYISFVGAKSGKELDILFENSDIAVGCLACHRKGIQKVRAIKNIEYAARGLPFIYSEINDDFEKMPYIYKIPADESPVNINEIINFYSSIDKDPQKIRNSIITKLSWNKQMSLVYNELVNKII